MEKEGERWEWRSEAGFQGEVLSWDRGRGKGSGGDCSWMVDVTSRSAIVRGMRVNTRLEAILDSNIVSASGLLEAPAPEACISPAWDKILSWFRSRSQHSAQRADIPVPLFQGNGVNILDGQN